MTSYVAVDLGAESGRVVVGRFDGERVALEVAHRFPNVAVRTPDGRHWDVLRLYGDILEGIQRAVRGGATSLAGIGIDAWGVDYALLDGAGRLLGNPYHYRDARTDGLPEAIEPLAPQSELYARTGIACLSINTIYQLLAQRQARDPILESAQTLLMAPDLLHYWLSGQIAVERTDASTSALLGVDGRWLTDVLDRLAIPSRTHRVKGGSTYIGQDFDGCKRTLVMLSAICSPAIDQRLPRDCMLSACFHPSPM